MTTRGFEASSSDSLPSLLLGGDGRLGLGGGHELPELSLVAVPVRQHRLALLGPGRLDVLLNQILELLLARGGLDALHRHNFGVHALGDVPLLLLEEVGDASRHAGTDVAASGAEHHHHATRHVLERVVAAPLHHRLAPRVADAEALAGAPRRKEVAAGGAIEGGVADNGLGRGVKLGLLGGADDDLPAMHALADVVVNLTDHLHLHPWQGVGPKRLPRGALEDEVKLPTALLKALVAPLLGDDARDAAADRAVRVDNVDLVLDLLLVVNGTLDLGVLEQVVVEHGAVCVCLAVRLVEVHPPPVLPHVGKVSHEGEVEVCRLGRLGVAAVAEKVGAAHEVLDFLVPEVGEDGAHLLSNKLKVVDDSLGGAGELLAQGLLLGGDAHGAVVGVADAGHDAALGNHGNGAESKLLGSHEGTHHNIPPGLQAPVDAQKHALAELALQEGAVHLREAKLPRSTGVLDRGEGGCAGAAVVARHLDHVGVCLGDAGRDRADAAARDELDRDLGLGIDLVQVVDELREVLNRVDVVVGGGRDERHPGLGEAQGGDVVVYLGAGELPPLAGLGALGELDLDLLSRH
mmetsp:Transcript_19801/g.45547  ORF Transcript_19801/g.45547 Transcript_19801/m.45547 type:complete len:577 (-) Transcript_19801:2090-3820(-)